MKSQMIAAVLSVAAALTASPASAEDGAFFEGKRARVNRTFQTSEEVSARQPMQYVTTVTAFGTDEQAEEAFGEALVALEAMAQGLAEQEGTDFLVEPREVEDVLPEELGDQRRADEIVVDTESLPVTFSMVRVREGNVLHVWFATGIGMPLLNLIDLTEDGMRFGSGDVAALVPNEIDGYELVEEEVTDEDALFGVAVTGENRRTKGGG